MSRAALEWRCVNVASADFPICCGNKTIELNDWSPTVKLLYLYSAKSSKAGVLIWDRGAIHWQHPLVNDVTQGWN